MKLIVGLGNPGDRYARSRHNVGFMCVDGLSGRAAISLSDRRSTASIGRGTIGGEDVVLAKPRTFMNNSGEALLYLRARFPVRLHDILIVYDDLDLPMGKIRIRPSGGAGGHRGMESIIDALGSQNVQRIRIGIGRPPPDVDEVPYVLGGFNAEEAPLIAEGLSMAQDAALDVLSHGLDWSMNRYN